MLLLFFCISIVPCPIWCTWSRCWSIFSTHVWESPQIVGTVRRCLLMQHIYLTFWVKYDSLTKASFSFKLWLLPVRWRFSLMPSNWQDWKGQTSFRLHWSVVYPFCLLNSVIVFGFPSYYYLTFFLILFLVPQQSQGNYNWMSFQDRNAYPLSNIWQMPIFVQILVRFLFHRCHFLSQNFLLIIPISNPEPTSDRNPFLYFFHLFLLGFYFVFP